MAFEIQPEDNRTAESKREFTKVYDKTAESLDEVIRQRFYPDVLDAMHGGDITVELRKRTLLRAVDETWVSAIEDALPAIDTIVRLPSHFIEENDEILPIELSRNIVPRSIVHLSQHANLIASIDGDDVMPNKILNVFRDDTIQTYENKFVNTLLNRLNSFVIRRYDQVMKNTTDARTTTLTYKEEFQHGEIKAKVNFVMELEEPPAKGDHNTDRIYYDDLFHRIERLRSICTAYMSSSFVKDMNGAYIRPPVSRTNAIRKNKNLYQCLVLWQFIESYENAGYTTTVRETVEKIDEEYLKNLYSSMAMEYVMFREKLHHGFDAENTLDSYEAPAFAPKIVEELVPTPMEEYEAHYGQRIPMPATTATLTQLDEAMLEAINVALDADREMREDLQRIIKRNSFVTVRRSFLAKLILSADKIKNYYMAVRNELLSYKKVKSRMSWSYDAFNRGRTKLAKLAFRGKTLCLYLALDPAEYDEARFHQDDASEVVKYADTPFCLKIRSDRALKYAMELIGILAGQEELVRGEDYTEEYHLETLTEEELYELGQIKYTESTEVEESFEGEPAPDTDSDPALYEDEVLFAKPLTDKIPTDLLVGYAYLPKEEKPEEIEAEEVEPITPEEQASIPEQAKEDAIAEAKAEKAEEPVPEENADAGLALAGDEEESGPQLTGVRRSFLAKLWQSDPQVQNYLVTMRNAVLSYKKVNSRISFHFDSINRGRTKLCKFGFRGKTLCIYLALDPNEFDESRFHHTDESARTKFAETPMCLKVRSDRGLKYALELIGVLAEKYGLIPTAEPYNEEYDLNYRSDAELYEMGQIRYLNPNEMEEVQSREPDALIIKRTESPLEETESDEAQTVAVTDAENAEETVSVSVAENAEDADLQVAPAVPDETSLLLAALAAGDDEDENGSLFAGVRRSFLARLWQADPQIQDYYVEMRNASLSYKKVNSRVSWNYDSVNRGRTKLCKFAFRGKTLCIYLALDPAEFDEAKYHHSDESGRSKYVDTPMCMKVRSDRALKYALELLGILAEKYGLIPTAEPYTEDYDLAYRTNEQLIEMGEIKIVNPDGTALSPVPATRPAPVEEIAPAEEALVPEEAPAEEPLPDAEATPDEASLSEEESDEEEDEDGALLLGADGVTRLRVRRSFLARLWQADPQFQAYYVEMRNASLSYKKVNSRVSWNYDSVNRGRTKLCKFAFRGKTLCIYLALDPKEFDENKYHHRDVSDRAKYADVPMCLRVRSDRALKYALELIGILAEKNGLIPTAEPHTEEYDLAYRTDEQLKEMGEIKIVNPDGTTQIPAFTSRPASEETATAEEPVPAEEPAISEGSAVPAEPIPADGISDGEEDADEEEDTDEEEDEDGESGLSLPGADGVTRERVRRSFTARLRQADPMVQQYFINVLFSALSYKKVTERISWAYDSVNRGRIKLCKFAFRGKTLCVYLALDPNAFDVSKYHHRDVSDRAKYAETPMCLRIRSPRAMKYALELIEILAEKNELVPRVGRYADDRDLSYLTDEELEEQGYLKRIVRTVPAPAPAEPDDFVALSDTVEPTPMEETPVEEAPVEEAPAEEAPVEEAPVEEIPAEEVLVEEETPVEEAPVEEAPAEEAPVEEIPVEDTPVEDTPVEEAPVEETPVEETPAEEPIEEEPQPQAQDSSFSLGKWLQGIFGRRKNDSDPSDNKKR